MSEQRTASKITAEIGVEYSPQSYVVYLYENGDLIDTYKSPDFHDVSAYIIEHKVADLIWLKE